MWTYRIYKFEWNLCRLISPVRDCKELRCQLTSSLKLRENFESRVPRPKSWVPSPESRVPIPGSWGAVQSPKSRHICNTQIFWRQRGRESSNLGMVQIYGVPRPSLRTGGLRVFLPSKRRGRNFFWREKRGGLYLFFFIEKTRRPLFIFPYQ